jgi:hypothetical protein
LEGLKVENGRIFYGNLEYIADFWPFGTFYGHFGNLVVIWYIFPRLVYCIKKNLATLGGVGGRCRTFSRLRFSDKKLTKTISEASDQGDQMSLRKYDPKCDPNNFLSKFANNFFRGKK